MSHHVHHPSPTVWEGGADFFHLNRIVRCASSVAKATAVAWVDKILQFSGTTPNKAMTGFGWIVLSHAVVIVSKTPPKSFLALGSSKTYG